MASQSSHTYADNSTTTDCSNITIPLSECSFPTPFYAGRHTPGFPPITLYELRLLDAFNSIVDEEDYSTKLKDKDIREKWHSELVEADLPHDQIEYLFNW
jgi:hypothetical protein